MPHICTSEKEKMNDMDEILDIFNDDLEKIGSAPRSACHEQGFLHQVVHCWMASRDGKRLYFQQRSFRKADFPGWYDVASGGHIASAEEPLDAALREIGEETGLSLRAEQLIDLGDFRTEDCVLDTFYDREFARVYLMLADSFVFAPGDEVEQMVSVPTEAFAAMLDGARDSVDAITPDGSALTIGKDKWCVDRGEFDYLMQSGRLPR